MTFNVNAHSCTENLTETCLFRKVNGSCLMAITTAGFFLNVLELYFLLCKLKLPSNQNVFLLNVAIVDVQMSVVGLIRGAGMIWPQCVGMNVIINEYNWFCPFYEIFMQAIGNTGMLVLVPLTIDRFIAVVMPLRHRYLITKSSSRKMSAVAWIPILVTLIIDIVAYNVTKGLEIIYDPGYLRCVRINWFVVQIVYLLIPFIPIILMYIAIVSVITRSANYCKHVLVNATVIIFTGILAYMPATITNESEIPMSFEFAQIGTVTFYYLNTVANPLVYFCMHPRAREALKEWLGCLKISFRNNCQNVYKTVTTYCSPMIEIFTKRCRNIWYRIFTFSSASKNSVGGENA